MLSQMREFENKRKIRRLIYSKLTILILFSILFFLVRGVIGIYRTSRISQQQLDLAEAKFAELEDRHNGLEAKLAVIESSVGQEEQLRQKFSLAKEGESAIIIIDQESPDQEEEKETTVRDVFAGLISNMVSGVVNFWDHVVFWD